MFLEPHFKGQRSGWIEVICGSMFSGKTEELLRRLRRARIAGQEVALFKPALDNRYHQTDVVSHDANAMPSLPIQKAAQMTDLCADADVVGIDEAQFFDLDLPKYCQEMALRGQRIIVAGLDMDYKGQPFGPMPAMLAVAEYITKLHAICMHCGNLATHSYRLLNHDAQVLVGETDAYEARCRTCFAMGNILRLKPRTKETP